MDPVPHCFATLGDAVAPRNRKTRLEAGLDVLLREIFLLERGVDAFALRFGLAHGSLNGQVE